MLELGIDDLAQVTTALAQLPRDLDDAQRIDLVATLEDLKNAACAAQAVLAVDFDRSQRATQVTAHTPRRRVGEGIAAQLGLARSESPFKGAQHLTLAHALDTQMPHTLARMQAGQLSEWRATLILRETACLDPADRSHVDRALCGPDGPATTLSDKALTRAATRLALELDTASVVERARKAETDRHVSVRPAPDTMTWVGALLPVKQGVALFAALKRAADSATAAGDPRSRGQVMADTLVQRVTGTPTTTPVRVDLDLVMSTTTLFGTSHEPAHMGGHGPVPATWAHDLVRDAASAGQLFVRRLFTTPDTGALIAMDRTTRRAPRTLAHLVQVRDQDLCRTPWCGAPLAHIDHVTEWHTGGPTTARNTQGLCARCNHAKQAHGWTARTSSGPDTERHTVETTTPTGHTYHSRAPAPPGHTDAIPSPVTCQASGAA